MNNTGINTKVWGNTATECSILYKIEQIYSTSNTAKRWVILIANRRQTVSVSSTDKG